VDGGHVDEPIGLLVTRTAKVVSRAFDDALAAVGGSLASWLVLVSLAGDLHPSQRSIAAAVGVEGPTLTHHLNRMEAAGFVTRARDPENRRVHKVMLTDSGRAEFGSMVETVQAFDRRLRERFSEAELATLSSLLRRLAENAATAGFAGGGLPADVSEHGHGAHRDEHHLATTIDELLTAWAESEHDADVHRLDTLLTDDFAGIGPVGFVLDKNAWLGRFEMGLHYEYLELDEVATHRHGDTAFVVARQHARGNAGPDPIPTDLRMSFTVVRDSDAAHRITGMQYSFIGPPAVAS
jgi:MarR family transcriptional regulator, transcriptional regulator for hemolysin